MKQKAWNLMDNVAGSPGAQIRCPRCQTAYSAQIINLIDARQHPELKTALLGGYLNRTVCPGCGAGLILNVPLVYHDPDKELLLVLAPSQLNMAPDQQERLVGGLVQAAMNSLPPEERKGYFLNPQTVLTMERLVQLILEADGITQEMLEAQKQRFRLLEDLVESTSDPVQMQATLEAHKGEIDYAFMATLTAVAQQANLAGDSEALERLSKLRDQLLADPEVAQRMPQPLPAGTTIEQATERLLSLLDDPEAFGAMVVLNRPSFDYLFFEGLTSQLEQAKSRGDKTRAERLTLLRSRLLEEIERQDKAVQKAQEEDLRLLDTMLSSQNLEETVREHLSAIDSLFLNTLRTAIEAARRDGNIERSVRLNELQQTIMAMIAESMPPELRLINQLLSLADPSERRAVLAEAADLLSEDLEALLQGILEEMKGQGRAETERRLQTILNEVQETRQASQKGAGSRQ